MNKQKLAIRWAVILGMAAAAAGAAHAEGMRVEGAYIGGAVGVPDYHSSIDGVTGSGKDAGYQLYGGYRISPYFGVELGAFDLGRIHNSTGHADARGGYVDAIGYLPMNDRFSLLGTVGVAQGRWSTSNGSDSSPAWKYGVGLQYDLTNAVSLRGEYERYQFTSAFGDRPGVGETTVGVNYRF